MTETRAEFMRRIFAALPHAAPVRCPRCGFKTRGRLFLHAKVRICEVCKLNVESADSRVKCRRVR